MWEEVMQLSTVDEILDFAVGKEEEAAEFYTDLAGRTAHEHMKDVFLGFAEEEKGHKAKLLDIKSGKQLLPSEKRILDLKIGDYLQAPRPSGDLDYKEALILAMKAEKAAFKLYHSLASATDDAGLKETLLGLAQEEAKHKLRFEIEYDDTFMPEM
jgi:rubrerythrin